MISNCVDAIFICLFKKHLCIDVIYIILNFFCVSISDDNIHNAVQLYKSDQINAILKYGLIEYWKTNNVTNMSKLFKHSNINFSINLWNVSNVQNMNEMFACAESFNQPLNKWNVSNVTDMNSMFYSAKSFNQSLNSCFMMPNHLINH